MKKVWLIISYIITYRYIECLGFPLTKLLLVFRTFYILIYIYLGSTSLIKIPLPYNPLGSYYIVEYYPLI